MNKLRLFTEPALWNESQTFQEGGTFLINPGSEPQDTYGGGFDATQAFVGDLANFHIWDRKLSVGEIYNLATCSSKAQVGNVFAWMETSLDIYGGASKWTFEACRQLNWAAESMKAAAWWDVRRWSSQWTASRLLLDPWEISSVDLLIDLYQILWVEEVEAHRCPLVQALQKAEGGRGRSPEGPVPPKESSKREFM